jgi:hypothetical protein
MITMAATIDFTIFSLPMFPIFYYNNCRLDRETRIDYSARPEANEFMPIPN